MILNSEGLFNGYGMVQRNVMRDPNLSIEVKGVYAYLCSFSGTGECILPDVLEQCKELGISQNRYYKYIQILMDNGYIEDDEE